MNAVSYRDTRMVGVDARGNRVGEDHPRATLTNAEVDLIRELADPLDGSTPMPQRQIAQKFEISRGTVSDIVRCRRRATTPSAYKRITIKATARFQTHENIARALNGEGVGG